PSTHIIEDWVSDLEDESKAEPSQNNPSFVQPTEQVKTPRPFVKPVEHPIPAAHLRQVTTAVPQPYVTRPRPAKIVVTKPYSPLRRTINRRPSPPASNFLPKVTTGKALKDNPHHALKDKGVIDSGCSRHMTGNMSYLTDFEEINSGYVSFGGNPKGGKISDKGKIRTGLGTIYSGLTDLLYLPN
nr:ribonuclease H-like domain-containing protein [Tanacetum cinerariifolium]